MKTLFFSVDVETSGPCPSTSDLLTIGVVPVLEDGTVLENRSFYVRINHGRPIRWEAGCHLWWHGDKPSAEAVRCAFGEHREEDGWQLAPYAAASRLDYWADLLLHETQCHEAAFVGHPAAFDWAFVSALLWGQLGHNLFGHRALCLRSLGFGLSGLPWASARTDDPALHVSSELPHHALHDAVAQARTLSRMLAQRAVKGPARG